MENFKTACLIFFTLITVTSCYYEDVDDSKADLITTDSELFELLQNVAATSLDNPVAITCVEIIYPISISTFDSSRRTVAVNALTTNMEFSAFLAALPANYAISVSYPITAQLADGSTLSITTNAQLKESIDACVDEQLVAIGNCQALLQDCTWKVGYSQASPNTYLGATLKETAGATNFAYDTILGAGSWTALFIENELYINLNLTSEPAVEQTFNRNWKVTYLDANSLQLTNGLDEIILHQYCNVPLDDCFDFNFKGCEDAATPGFTDIFLEDYDFCINQILQYDIAVTTITFHPTEADASIETAAIDPSVPFRNTNLTETFFVRVSDSTTGDFYIVPMTITVGPCL
jgi:hypothetical protein